MIFAVFSKFYKEFRRNRISYGLVFVFPLFFLFIFNIGFGGAEIQSDTTYSISIINEDKGIPSNIALILEPFGFPKNWLDTGMGKNVSDIIFDLNYEKDDVVTHPVFERVDMNDTSVEDAVQDGLVTLVMVIPENFSLTILNSMNNQAKISGSPQIPFVPDDMNSQIEFTGDERNTGYGVAKAIISGIMNNYLEQVKTSTGDFGDVQIDFVSVIPVTESISIFDFIATGLFVFATILGTSYLSAALLTDDEGELDSRYRISLMQPRDYLIGFSLFAGILMLIQGVFMFLAAHYLFDFHPIGSYLRAYVILIILILANLGFIFTVAAFFKTPDTAGSAVGFSSSIIGFISGSFTTMPNVILLKDIFSFTSGSPDLLLWDLFPWTHANNAMKAILFYDQSLMDVIGDITLLVVMGVLWYVLGIFLYSKMRSARRDL